MGSSLPVSINIARVAELADAEDSKSFGRKVVRVQVPPRAPISSF